MKKKPSSIDTQLALMSNNIEYIKRDVEDIKRTLKADYVTRSEFEPIKKVVYGMVSLILVAVVGGLVGLVVTK